MTPKPSNKSTVLQTTNSGAGDFPRRDFLKGALATGVVVGGGIGGFYFGYNKSVGSPVRVGVIGTGDEGSVLLGAITPSFVEVKSIADIRPYSIWRAFNGDHYSDAAQKVRPGLMSKYGWKTELEARKRVKVYNTYQELIAKAKDDGLEGVIIALPLHLHAEVAVAAMKAGLHVLTEKLMGHSVHECKEMARVAKQTNLHLATGHQRHYNILYANAMDSIRRGLLGDLHYIRAQWHRGNLPGNDSWQPPMPADAKPKDPLADSLQKKLTSWQKELAKADGPDLDAWRVKVDQVIAQISDKNVKADKYGYQSYEIKDPSGKVLYNAPAIEELIRWRLWDRTGAGLMAELGSHQLDAATLFIAAAHDGKKQHPISVVASANRPLFPADRDVEDHVYCILEFPAPGYDPKDPQKDKKKIGVQYSSINGNGFGGYGEIVFGTKRTMIVESEKEMSIVPDPAAAKISITAGKPAALDTQASGPIGGPAAKSAAADVSRGYTEEIEHWAWCIRHPAPENQPRCHPAVAMGDAVIALTANISARKAQRIEFKEEWFDIDSDETPENTKPDISRYK